MLGGGLRSASAFLVIIIIIIILYMKFCLSQNTFFLILTKE